MSIGQRIKEMRWEKRMSAAELARSVGVSPQAVSNWETGIAKGPSRDILPRVADALGVTLDALLRPDPQEGGRVA